MEILLSLAYTALFLFLIGKMNIFKGSNTPIKWFQFVFLLKILSGIALWYIYTYYYTDRLLADIYKYFDDSAVMFRAIPEHPGDFFKMLTGIGLDPSFREKYFGDMNNWYRAYSSNFFNDNQTIIRYNAFLRLFSLGHYHVHSVFTCFLSLIGLASLYKVFISFMPDKRKLVFFSVFLIPSVVFWGSGVLKEGLLMMALGLFTLSLQKIATKQANVIIWLVAIASTGILLVLKLYVFIALAPAIVGLFLTLRSKRFVLRTYLIVFALFLVGTANINSIIPSIDPLRVLTKKQGNFINASKGITMLRDSIFFIGFEQDQRHCLIRVDTLKYRIKKGCECTYWKYHQDDDTLFFTNTNEDKVYKVAYEFKPSNSYFPIPKLSPKPSRFLETMPTAIANSFFRPLPTDIHSVLVVLPALENVLYLIIFLMCLFFRKKNPEHSSWAWFCFFYVLLLYLIIGWTTPVMGAMVRYKVPALPYLLLFALFFLDVEKLLKKFPWLQPFVS